MDEIYIKLEMLPNSKVAYSICEDPSNELVLWNSYSRNLPFIQGKRLKVYYESHAVFTREHVINLVKKWQNNELIYMEFNHHEKKFI